MNKQSQPQNPVISLQFFYQFSWLNSRKIHVSNLKLNKPKLEKSNVRGRQKIAARFVKGAGKCHKAMHLVGVTPYAALALVYEHKLCAIWRNSYNKTWRSANSFIPSRKGRAPPNHFSGQFVKLKTSRVMLAEKKPGAN